MITEPTPTRIVRPWFVVCVVVVAVVVISGLGYHRWDLALVHGSMPLFSRTTSDGVQIDVERGDVRVQRTTCPSDGTWSSTCEKRVPGVAVRLALPDGRGGGGTSLADAPDPPSPDVFEPAQGAHVIVTAGLGIPPGSIDEQFIVVRTDPLVVRVRATHTDGSIDEMAPVDGLAVLATRTGWKPSASVEAFAADGRPLAVG